MRQIPEEIKKGFPRIGARFAALVGTWFEEWADDPRNRGASKGLPAFAQEVFGYSGAGATEIRKVTRSFEPGAAMTLLSRALDTIEDRGKRGVDIPSNFWRRTSCMIELFSNLRTPWGDDQMAEFKRLSEKFGHPMRFLQPLTSEDHSLPFPCFQDSSKDTYKIDYFRAPSAAVRRRGRSENGNGSSSSSSVDRLKAFLDDSDKHVCCLSGKIGKTQVVLKLLESVKSTSFLGGKTYINARNLVADEMTNSEKLGRILIRLLDNCSTVISRRSLDSPEVTEARLQNFLRKCFKERKFVVVIDNVPLGFRSELKRLIKTLRHTRTAKIILVWPHKDMDPPSNSELGVKKAERIRLNGRLSDTAALESMKMRFQGFLSDGCLRSKAFVNLIRKGKGEIEDLNQLSTGLAQKILTSNKSISDAMESALRRAPSFRDIEHMEALEGTAAAPLAALSVFREQFSRDEALRILSAANIHFDGLSRYLDFMSQSLGLLIPYEGSAFYRFTKPSYRSYYAKTLPVEMLDAVMFEYCKIMVDRLKQMPPLNLLESISVTGNGSKRQHAIEGSNLQRANHFDSETKPDLMRALDWSATAGLYDRTRAEAFLELLNLSVNYLRLYVPVNELRIVGQKALELIDCKKATLELYHAKSLLSDACYRNGYYLNAQRLSDSRIRIARQLAKECGICKRTSSELQMDALWDRGRSNIHLALQQGQPPIEPLADFTDANRLALALPDDSTGKLWKAQAEAELGWAKMQNGEFCDALEMLERSMDRSWSLGNLYSSCRAQIDLGRCFRKMAQIEQDANTARQQLYKARRQTNEAMLTAERMGSRMLAALAARGLSLIDEQLEDYGNARFYESRWIEWKRVNEHPYVRRSLRRLQLLQ